uniref:Uncharacterized protein n=1 Tax=Myoviridae sp. ctcPl3 TaxID=2826669 RepID=A0A8S5QVP7_9CAUD|nr:MAG TPA: hypothetical protein [Myoviridae sp. ctcPl3]
MLFLMITYLDIRAYRGFSISLESKRLIFLKM